MKMWRKLSKLSSEDIGCYWVPLQQCPTLQCVGEEEKRLLGWLKREGLVLCPVQGLVCSLGESGEKEITLKDFCNLLIEWTNVAVEWLGDTDDAKNFVRHVKVVSKSKDDIDSTILQLQAMQSCKPCSLKRHISNLVQIHHVWIFMWAKLSFQIRRVGGKGNNFVKMRPITANWQQATSVQLSMSCVFLVRNKIPRPFSSQAWQRCASACVEKQGGWKEGRRRRRNVHCTTATKKQKP